MKPYIRFILIIAGSVVVLCFIGIVFIFSTGFSFRLTIKPACPPVGYELENGTSRPFEWTERSFPSEISTPLGDIVLVKDGTGEEIRTTGDGYGIKILRIQATDTWTYYKFAVRDTSQIFGPMHILVCNDTGMLYIDLHEALLRFLDNADI